MIDVAIELKKNLKNLETFVKSFCLASKRAPNIRAFLSNILALKSFANDIFFSTNFNLKTKMSILDEIAKFCKRILPYLKNTLSCDLNPQTIEIIIDLISALTLLGCEEILHKSYKLILRTISNNLDLLAHLADTLIDLGFLKEAYLTLKLLLKSGYNQIAVLLNLAIISYMLGYPQTALNYLRTYEQITGRKSSLLIPIKIALAEFSKLK